MKRWLLTLTALIVTLTTSAARLPDRPAPASPSSLPRSAALEGQLTAHRMVVAPVVDGQMEALWGLTPSLIVHLEGDRQVELRALYDEERIYFLARWQELQPRRGAGGVVANKLSISWKDLAHAQPWQSACSTACHTAYTADQYTIGSVNAESIPPTVEEDLVGRGGWHDGVWTLEWSRPLQCGNLFDVQFTDLAGVYPFVVKMFEEDGPDPVSELYLLVFQP